MPEARAADCGHGKYYANGLCRSCYEKDLRSRNPGYAQRQRDNAASWHADLANKDRRKRQVREYHLRSTFGITVEQYEQRLEEQGGGCALCGSARDLVNDHDRKCCPTAKSCGKCWRGILCRRCNVVIAYAEGEANDDEWFERVRLYLSTPSSRGS